jgi:hypothetical protein
MPLLFLTHHSFPEHFLSLPLPHGNALNTNGLMVLFVCFFLVLQNNSFLRQALVTHACNLSYMGG